MVIPGLVRLGYDLEDARNYTVAACWEFIIPGVAMDIPNIGAMPLAEVVREACEEGLETAKDFESFKQRVVDVLNRKAKEITDGVKNIFIEPAPWQSVMMRDCLTTGRDISEGAKYNNYGIHGTGLANAVDALAAVRKFVFEEKSVAPAQLLRDMDEDFSEDAQLLHTLRTARPEDGPRRGMRRTGRLAAGGVRRLFEGHPQRARRRFPRRYRLGNVLRVARRPSGRDRRRPPQGRAPAGELLPLADALGRRPALGDSRLCRPALTDAINGGPLTLELHDTVFRNEEGSKKVAQLVRTFIQLGGHQLQLNAVDRDTLIDAQKHPEKHRQLIVRVWGWSGHFVQLDRMYQDQIIARTSYSI